MTLHFDVVEHSCRAEYRWLNAFIMQNPLPLKSFKSTIAL